jgi:hypothetical protein
MLHHDAQRRTRADAKTDVHLPSSNARHLPCNQAQEKGRIEMTVR